MATLFLIPTTLGESPIDTVLPAYNTKIILSLRHFIVENVRTARRFLKQIDSGFPIDDCTFHVLNKHTSHNEIAGFLQALKDGFSMGIISEAGCPAIADPGAEVVALAQQDKIKVTPLVGPSSILLALMASGFNGQCFAFHGYLPIDGEQRSKTIKVLEQRMYAENQTQLFIETPYRNNKLAEDLLKICKPSTKLCIAADITLETELIQTRSIGHWKGKIPDLSKRPCLFLLGI